MKKLTILALHLGFGGIEKCIATLSNMLVDTYDVEIISIYKLYEKPSFEIDSKVKIRYLLEDRTPNREAFKKALQKKNPIKITKEGFEGMKTLLLRKKTMIDAIEKCDSDIIISTRDILNEWLSLYGNKDALRIGWEHNHHHNNQKYANSIIRSSKNLDYLVLVSQDLQKYYAREMKDMPCKCIYIPNTVDYIPEKLSPLKEKRLISVGRLSPEKAHKDLLHLMVSIHEKYPDWHLDLIGDGPSRFELEKIIKEKNLKEVVTLHGFQNSDYINKYLSKSSCFLMTSFTESFGIVLLEAMSHGIPCIAYNSAEGAREIIESGENGYLIKNRNEEAYLKKVFDLIENKEERIKIGKKARESITKYSKEAVKEDWLQLLSRK